MAKFTRALRQQIIDEFLAANNGWYDPAAFVSHIKAAGPDHPAYDWFTWDDESAAHQHRLDQARDFARGLRIKFEVNVIEHGVGKVVSRESPMFVSPSDKRRDGGGYYRNDPDDPAHLAEMGAQAATDLGWWLRRYAAPLAAVGADLDGLENLRVQLAAMKEADAA
jgi:hypothetical protein